MNKPRLRGNKAVFEGRAYDVKKVVGVFHRVVCATMDALGVKEAKVGTKHPHLPTSVLPHPGLEQSEQIWERMRREYDVVDEPLIYDLGAITFRAFLLGRSWCVFRPETKDIVTSDGLPVSAINSAPTVCVSAERQQDGSFALLSTAKMDFMDKVLLPFGLTIDGVNCNTEEGHTVAQKQYLSFISFPYEKYGAGRKELKARCVLPDGSEIKIRDVSGLN